MKTQSSKIGNLKNTNIFMMSSGSMHENYENDHFNHSQVYGRDNHLKYAQPQQPNEGRKQTQYSHPKRGYHSQAPSQVKQPQYSES